MSFGCLAFVVVKVEEVWVLVPDDDSRFEREIAVRCRSTVRQRNYTCIQSLLP